MSNAVALKLQRVAHSSRVLANASSRSRTFPLTSGSSLRTTFEERLFRRDAETSTRDACATQTTNC